MNFVTEDLANLIAQKIPTLGQIDKDIFYDYMPQDGTDVVVFTEYQGSAVAYNTFTSVRSVQCCVRNKSNTQAMKNAWAIFDALEPDNPFLELGNVKAILNMRDTPFSIGIDDLGRSRWVFNMGITYNYK